MNGSSRDDIRRLLKTFGIQADEATIAHLARYPNTGSLRVRLVLEDLTDYQDSPPEEPLRLEIKAKSDARSVPRMESQWPPKLISGRP